MSASVLTPRPGRANGSRLSLTVVSVVVAAAVPALVAGIGAGPSSFVAVIAVEQFLLSWAWVRTFAGSMGTLAIAGSAALVSDAIALIVDSHEIGDYAGVVGVAVAAVILVQLARRRASPPAAILDQTGAAAGAGVADGPSGDHPPERSVRVTVDMAAGLSGVVVVTMLTTYADTASLTAPASRVAGAALVAAALASGGSAVLCVRTCAAISTGRPVLTRLAGLATGVVVGAVFGAVSSVLTVFDGTVIAAVAAAVAVVIDAVVARGVAELQADGAVGLSYPLAAVLPLAVAAPFVYAVAHTLVR
ncbi:hypothetical protein [Frankia sp. Cj3]|uniref:hypothetical protein n=1 Tax=Frankia sp. Cj3 TaxID=2880976 RepID=UPI001EF6492E|nr:hypothetical protein [Frankia sp. Cj3]